MGKKKKLINLKLKIVYKNKRSLIIKLETYLKRWITLLYLIIKIKNSKILKKKLYLNQMVRQ